MALPGVARLDEITGCGPVAAMAVIAEVGLDMTVSAPRDGSPARFSPSSFSCSPSWPARKPAKGFRSAVINSPDSRQGRSFARVRSPGSGECSPS
jgi:hypothetical protein